MIRQKIEQEQICALERRIAARVAKEVCEDAVIEHAKSTSNTGHGRAARQFGDKSRFEIRTIVKTKPWSKVVIVIFPETCSRVLGMLADGYKCEAASRRRTVGILVDQSRELAVYLVWDEIQLISKTKVERQIWTDFPSVFEEGYHFVGSESTIIAVGARTVFIIELVLLLDPIKSVQKAREVLQGRANAGGWYWISAVVGKYWNAELSGVETHCFGTPEVRESVRIYPPILKSGLECMHAFNISYGISNVRGPGGAELAIEWEKISNIVRAAGGETQANQFAVFAAKRSNMVVYSVGGERGPDRVKRS